MAFISSDVWRELDHFNNKLNQYWDMKKQEWKQDIKDVATTTGETINDLLKPLTGPLIIFGGLLLLILLIK